MKRVTLLSACLILCLAVPVFGDDKEDMTMMDNVTYLDLHQPWLVSPAR